MLGCEGDDNWSEAYSLAFDSLHVCVLVKDLCLHICVFHVV